MPRRPRPQPPLPPRDGLGPARVRMPPAPGEDSSPGSVVKFLTALTGDPDGVCRRVAAGEVVLDDGTVVTEATPYRPGRAVYLYRDLSDEVEVPGEMPVLLRDDGTGLLVVDKPPFLATTPRGRHVAQTALVRLRRGLQLPDLTPVHRLDRLTSGVLLLTTRPSARRPYQMLMQSGGVRKTYEALAPLPEALDLPVLVHDRLVKPRGELQARVVPGTPNARTLVELLEVVEPGVGRYRLTPTTGQTHQLRVHLAGLGIPVLGDPLYPVVSDVAPGDFSNPLQLLAAEVCLTDPLSGRERRITSARTLPIGPSTG